METLYKEGVIECLIRLKVFELRRCRGSNDSNVTV